MSGDASGEETAPILTMSIPEAARELGVGRNAAYEAAKRGEIPVIKIGRLRRVPVARFRAMLGVG